MKPSERILAIKHELINQDVAKHGIFTSSSWIESELYDRGLLLKAILKYLDEMEEK